MAEQVSKEKLNALVTIASIFGMVREADIPLEKHLSLPDMLFAFMQMGAIFTPMLESEDLGNETLVQSLIDIVTENIKILREQA